ncbi:MAG: type II toxin-antitoxin system RelB/DinJ family antitoxin [Clostridia bacterium]|nr:type II toxin-antitoxin system RelB/DinJ family antitoxin [Clostridia bacterium]
MAKNASVFTRIDPVVKEQAENVLNQLGISMATAMEMYLRQIAMQRKIPFEIALQSDKPIAYGSITDGQFNTLMEKSFAEYKNGETISAEDVEREMNRKYGL